MCYPTIAVKIIASSLGLKLPQHRHFSVYINCLPFPWMKYSEILAKGRISLEETFKIEQIKGL